MLAQTGWRGGGVVLDGGKLGKVGVEMKDGEGQLFLASVCEDRFDRERVGGI